MRQAGNRRRGLIVVALLLGLAAARPVGVRAATDTVSVCDESTLRGVIAAATAGDTVTFGCSGTITLTVGGGPIELSKNLTIDGRGQAVTISGGGSVGVFVVDSDVTAALNALTIANGRVNGHGTDGDAAAGAGIDNKGTLTLTNSTVSGNSAGSPYSTTSPFLAGSGGGIANEGGASLSIANSTISGNTATGPYGGGIFNHAGAMLTITGSIISGNSVDGDGGGVLSFSTVSITDSIFRGNRAEYGPGGGCACNGGTITGSTFVDNSSISDGGGIVAGDGNGTLTITNSTFSGNSAPSGGGISALSRPLIIANSTFSGNSATGTSVQAPTGGNIWTGSGTLQLTNTILAAGGAGGDCGIGITGITDGGGDLADDPSCGFTQGSSFNGATSLDLGPLADNGGKVAGAPTSAATAPTIALLPGSVAIDFAGATCPSTDQRGSPRPDADETRCDSGAYEAQDPENNLALASVPANITTDATSPAGAVVSYTPPSAVDGAGDATPQAVACTPASGATFAIGTTTVTCTATDSDDANSPVSATFAVMVKGAAAQINEMIALVNGMNIASGLKSSLDTQLQAVLADLQANNTNQACNDLAAFVNHVQSQVGKGLTTGQAQQLLALASNIMKVVGC